MIPVFEIFLVSLICKLHIWRSIRRMTYRRMLYLCYYKMKSLQNVHVWWEKHTYMITSKWFRFIIVKIYHILRYVIPLIRHMCNLRIKETEISQKRSKGIKNWKITYSVILTVLSNKTNLILGFSSPLTNLFRFAARNYRKVVP